MGIYKYLQHQHNSTKEHRKALQKSLIEWRRSLSIVKLPKPTKLTRAHSLGYKAKQGYITVRVRLKRGGRQRPRFKAGRRSKHMRRKKIVKENYQVIAEKRAARKYKNCEVLGSYETAKDGKYYWYEILLADRIQVSKYHEMKWLLNTKSRVLRGLTSAGRKSRGLRHIGKGAEKIRPSLAAHSRKGK